MTQLTSYRFIAEVTFKDLGFLNPCETTPLIVKPNQLTTNQTDWFLCERDPSRHLHVQC